MDIVIYLVSNAVALCILGVVWNVSNFLNFIIKVALFTLGGVGVYYSLTHYGYTNKAKSAVYDMDIVEKVRDSNERLEGECE